MAEDRYLFNGMGVSPHSGYDEWLRGDPWETDYRIGGPRDPMFWAFAARKLNGLPTFEQSSERELIAECRRRGLLRDEGGER
jgi:hypothetical protein